jgi:hypothetical protein
MNLASESQWENHLMAPVARVLGPHEPLPNLLHVGYSEATRLHRPEPAAGPLAQLIQWARGLPSDAIDLVFRGARRGAPRHWSCGTQRAARRPSRD